MITTKSGE